MAKKKSDLKLDNIDPAMHDIVRAIMGDYGKGKK